MVESKRESFSWKREEREREIDKRRFEEEEEEEEDRSLKERTQV